MNTIGASAVPFAMICAPRVIASVLFKVLSHPDRLRLACALGDGRTTTQRQLVEEFGWPQSTTARHLAALRSAGLVTAERDGQEILLRLGSPVALHLLDTVCDWVHQPTSSPFSDPWSMTTDPALTARPTASLPDGMSEEDRSRDPSS